MSISRRDTELTLLKKEAPSAPSSQDIRESNVELTDDFEAHLSDQLAKLEGIDIAKLMTKTTETLIENPTKAKDMIEYLFMATEDPISRFSKVAADLKKMVFENRRTFAELNEIGVILLRTASFAAPSHDQSQFAVIKNFTPYITLQTKAYLCKYALRDIKHRIPKWSVDILSKNTDMTYTEGYVEFSVSKPWQFWARERYSIKIAPMNPLLAKDSELLYKYYCLLLNQKKAYAANLELLNLYALFLSNKNHYYQAIKVGVLPHDAGCINAFKRIVNEISYNDTRKIYTKYIFKDTHFIRFMMFIEVLARGIVIYDINVAIFLITVLAYTVSFMSAIWTRASTFIALANLPGGAHDDGTGSSMTAQANIQFTLCGTQDVYLTRVKDAMLYLLGITAGAGVIARIILQSVFLD